MRARVCVAAILAGLASAGRAQEPALAPAGPAALPLAEIGAALTAGERWCGMFVGRRSIGTIRITTEPLDDGWRVALACDWTLEGRAQRVTETATLGPACCLRRWTLSTTAPAGTEIRDVVREGARGRGTIVMTPAGGAPRTRPIDVELPPDAIPVNLLHLVAPAVPWSPGTSRRVTLFVSSDGMRVPGLSAAAELRADGAGPVHTPGGTVDAVFLRLTVAGAGALALPELHVAADRVAAFVPSPSLPGLRICAAADAAGARADLPFPWPAETEDAVRAATRAFLRAWLVGDPEAAAAAADLDVLHAWLGGHVPAVAAMDGEALRADFLGRVRGRAGKNVPAAMDRRLDAMLPYAALDVIDADATVRVPPFAPDRPPQSLALRTDGDAWRVTAYTGLLGG